MVKTDSDVIIEKCVRNSGGVLAVNNEENNIVLQSHHDKFLISFWFCVDRNSLFQIRESSKKMKNNKASGPSSLVSEMLP